MIATARGTGWGPATTASHVHSLEDPARRTFVSTDLSGPAGGVAREPSSTPPPPNPPFVFPARLASPSTAPSLHVRPDGPRPVSATESDPPSSPSRENGERPRKGLALPAFSFNPGASLGQEPESSAFLSPPITPTSQSPRPIPSPVRPTRHGHRRGGSEFIGGSIRDGNSIALISTSPTKSDSGFASSAGLAPPARRHRRGLSGAVSAHDLSQLSKSPAHVMPRGSSAPNSPTYFTLVRDIPFPAHDKDLGTPDTLHLCRDAKSPGDDDTMEAARPTTPVAHTSDSEPSSPRQARLGRTRVGFSDKLEFIPRPLSLVSSDTSSTATARPGHSVSGSISSIVSVASPSGRGHPTVLPRSPARELTDSRPSTAGAVLENLANLPVNCAATNASPRRRNSTPTLLAMVEAQAPIQASNTSTVRAPKRWSFFGFEPSFISSAAPSKPRPSSSSSSLESVIRGVSGASSSDHDSDSTETGKESQVSGSNKRSRKRRVKGWAGSILPRKPKGHKKHRIVMDLQPPTLPASVDRPEEDTEQDTDDAETPGPDSLAFRLNVVEPPAVAQGSCGEKRQSRDDASYPMIDLDAALGPFNTPLPLNPEWEAAQRAAGSSGKRRMHSAQGMKNFSGPGMHYHRRAESAPDLPPFDLGRSGVPRFNSNSTMADVFEEDEDEEGITVAKDQVAIRDIAAFAALRGSGPSHGATGSMTRSPVDSSALAAVVPSSTTATVPSQVAVEEGESDEKATGTPARTQCSKGSLRHEVVEETPSIIFCSANAMFNGPDVAMPSPQRLTAPHEASPLEPYTASMPPISPRSTTHTSSAHASPRSPMSADTPRMSTAPSMTDKNSLQSLLMGEPGPEVRISADYDMRSLASSNSTMTRDSAFIPSQRMSQPSFREQRPVSVSSAAFGRRRSSLVSLSRLISSAHGERSKLSMEVTLDNEPEVKKSKSVGSKTKERLGRMIQFWKPKDGAVRQPE